MLRVTYTLPAIVALLLSSCLAAVNGQVMPVCEVNAIQFTTTDALGPFYVPESERTGVIAPRQLLIDPANVFTVNGKVLGNDCVPLAGARVESWYAGDGGEYEEDQFRGQVFTDACGNFQFTQTFPAIYTQRPIPHIHYRISSADDMELLVTQLYFEGVIVPGVGSPDVTKISKIVNEADGSRSAEFHVYVSVLGTADIDACSETSAEGVLQVDSTMLPSDIETMLPSEEDFTNTIMPSEDATGGMMVDDDETTIGTPSGKQRCGSVLCDLGLECCNASCGTCTEPGGLCRMVGCVGPSEQDVGTDSSISKRSSGLFD